MTSPHLRRRSLVRTLVCTAAALGLAGCAGLMGPPTVTLSESELERLLQRSFPLERQLLDVFVVTVDTPRLRLRPESNRLAAELDVRARDRLFAGRWQGRCSFEAALRWEPRDQTLRLTQVRVQDLALDNPASPVRSTTERIGAALAERVLEDLNIYRLPPERADKLRQAGYVPGAVTVTSRGVEITFAAAPR
jgi:hypothetical protein